MGRARWFRLLAALFAFALLAAACGDDDDDEAGDDATTTEAPEDTAEEEPSGEAIIFGTLLPESGSLAAIVRSLTVPIDLAVEEINAAGGILGREVTIEGADDGTDDLTVASTSFERLATSVGVDALFGPASSDLNEGLMPEFASADFPSCNGSSTSAALPELEDGGRWFQFAPNDNLQGPALAEVISNDGHASVAVLTRNDTYGTGFGGAIADELDNLGIDVVFNESYDPEADSFTAEVERLSQSGADATAIIGFNDDGGQVIADMIEQGIGPGSFPIYTGDGMQGSTFWEAVGSDPSVVEGIKGTAPAAAPAGVEHPFSETFAATGVDTIFSAYYYDCAITVALAMEAAGTTDVEAVSEAVFEVTSGDTECQGFEECRDLLDEGESISISGASGVLTLDEGGSVTTGSYDIWQYNAEGEPATLDEPQIQLSLEE